MIPFAKYIIPLVFCICCNRVYAQPGGVQKFIIEQPGQSIRLLTLSMANNGFLLVGTTNGLYRFDGAAFVKIPFADTFHNTSITAIAVEKNGKTWLGFDNGDIGIVEKNFIRKYNSPGGNPSVAINFIFIDSARQIYFATAGEGIYYYKNSNRYIINSIGGLSDDYVYQLVAEGNGFLATTDKGINNIHWKNGKAEISTFTSVKGLPDNIVRCIYPYKKSGTNRNGWFVGMNDRGVGVFDYTNARGKFRGIGNYGTGQVNSLLYQDDELWIATENNGVARLNTNNGFLYPGQLELQQVQSLSNLIKDGEGNIWFTSKTHLYKTNGTQLTLQLPFTKKMFEETHALHIDKNEAIWINSNEGLEKYSFNYKTHQWSVQKFRLPEVSSKTDITALYQDEYGLLWVGTFGKGVIIFDPLTGKHRSFDEDDLLINGSIISISGQNGKVGISSLGGAVLCKLTTANSDISNPYKFENFSRIKDIGTNYIYSMLVDSRGRVWFATDGKGITVLSNGKFINYNKAHGINSNVVYNICEDQLGNIWFSTLEGGIYKFDGNFFTNINVTDGLLSPTITAMSVDNDGNIVTVCSKGINIINPNTNQVLFMDETQGIEELNTDLNCISSQNGAVYFISRQGVRRYYPSFNKLQPQLTLLNVQLFLEDIDFSSPTHFSYNENNFTFTYAGISFSHPSKIKYRYVLEGFGTEWNVTKDNSVNFPKLPPGQYTFKVMASLHENFDNAKLVSYQFTIAKPFWLQWWFVAGTILLLSVLVYVYMKAREKRIKRLDRVEKEKIQSQFETLKSQVNPHFLFNSFNTLISVIEENPHLAVEYVEHLSDLYRKIVTYRDKDVITLDEEIRLINDYFFIQKKRFGDNLQLQNFISAADRKNYLIAPLTLQMLCENAVKHNAISTEMPLVIELKIEDKILFIKNKINQKLTAEMGEGMGLQNIKKRYQLLDKREVKIEKNKGEFIVYIPLIEVAP